MSTKEVADLLEISERTVQRSLDDPATADREWGKDGWREKPLSLRRIVQVRRSAAEAKAQSGARRPLGEMDAEPPVAE